MSNKPTVWCVPQKIDSGNGWTRWKCARGCGFSDIDRHGHYPERIYHVCNIQRRGLGDFLGLALAQIGITKQRWAKWTGRPLPEQKAGCQPCHERQQAINRFGWSWQHRFNKIDWWVRHRYAWIESKANQFFKIISR